jgi:hypothetical protein
MQHFPALRMVAALAAVLLISTGCGKKDGSTSKSSAPAEKEDWVQTADVTPEERVYLDYGRGVIESVAARSYSAFYDELSSHARARMSLNQFMPEEDEAAFAKREKQPKVNVALPEFEQLMIQTEQKFGQPLAPLDLHVHSSDPKILSGNTQGLDAIDAMFAIGNMPASIPAAIRKTSLRAKIKVSLSAEDLAKTAKAYEVSVEELQKDPDFQPYFTLKLVLVDEAGQLKVGYFEFLPPSMMD